MKQTINYVHVFLAVLLLMGVELSAQTVEGTVAGLKAEPLVGASVYWLGSTDGITTDMRASLA